MTKAASTLRNWLVAQLMATTVVGVLTWLGLWAIGVPLAPILGLVAALFAFIPNIGPVIAAVPALLLAIPATLLTALGILLTREIYVLDYLAKESRGLEADTDSTRSRS